MSQAMNQSPVNQYSLPQPPELPSQVFGLSNASGYSELHYDFNHGARLKLEAGSWYVELYDADTGNLLFAQDVDEGWVTSSKKFYVRFGFKVWRRGESSPCFVHELDLKNKDVMIHVPVGTLGDVLAWFPYIEKFRLKHQCRILYTMADEIAQLFSETYPKLRHVPLNDLNQHTTYATYTFGLFFDDAECVFQPIDFRLVGLHKTAAHILGVEPEELRPKLSLNMPRIIQEPYVCIAVQASTQCKKWNNPRGWMDVVSHLKKRGYRVLCIDKDPLHGQTPAWTYAPYEAEDYTGALPLKDRVALLAHADLFIGVSSGLAWLAWACHIPVVMISGFTLPYNEFSTPYRIFNIHTCNGCWNDVRHRFDHFDFFWCPRHKGTSRQFECSSLITSQHVLSKIDAALAHQKMGLYVADHHEDNLVCAHTNG